MSDTILTETVSTYRVLLSRGVKEGYNIYVYSINVYSINFVYRPIVHEFVKSILEAHIIYNRQLNSLKAIHMPITLGNKKIKGRTS